MKILRFAKFGNENHLSELRQHGILHMRSLRYFRNLDDSGDGRADPDEGLDAYSPSTPDLRITLDNVTLSETDIESVRIRALSNAIDTKSPLCEQLKTAANNPVFTEDSLNLFCLYAHTVGAPLTIDKRFIDEYQSVLVIYNPREFLRRVDRIAEIKRVRIQRGWSSM